MWQLRRGSSSCKNGCLTCLTSFRIICSASFHRWHRFFYGDLWCSEMRAMCHIEPRLQKTYVLKLLFHHFVNSQKILFFSFWCILDSWYSSQWRWYWWQLPWRLSSQVRILFLFIKAGWSRCRSYAHLWQDWEGRK